MTPKRRKSLRSKLHIVVAPERYDYGKMTAGVNDLPGTPSGVDRLVIAPGNRLVALFDVLVAICVLYTAVVACDAAESNRAPGHGH